MDTIEKKLLNWRASLVKSIPVAGLLSRNSVAYKWKGAWRCWILREVLFWRLSDLLTQSYALHCQGHLLGARIILRSGFETLAVLIYLNQLIAKVIEGNFNFHLFCHKTSILLLGSRDGSTEYNFTNIATILNHCDKRYPGLEKLYGILSESAHPNYEGILAGYSILDRDQFETHFANRWMEIYGKDHPKSIELCIETFSHEYDDVWTHLMSKFEIWIEIHDMTLEATKDDPVPFQ